MPYLRMEIAQMQGTNTKGFTLIEITVVLVIIGLMVGGVMVGQSLIRNSKLQAAVAEIDSYKKAIGLFKTKYNALPGDMTNATTFWGTDAGGCPSSSNITPKTATCNGNGDSFITGSGGIPYTTGTESDEQLYAWQHLANSGFIKGLYTGAVSSTTTGLEAGINIPLSELDGSAYTLTYSKPLVTTANYFASPYGHIIAMGGANGLATTNTAHGVSLTAQDAQILDNKIDDGKPGIGTVLSFPGGGAIASTCVTSSPSASASGVANTAIYSRITTGIICTLVILTGY